MIENYPTIQEIFDAIMTTHRQRNTLETSFELSCNEFVEKYRMRPPYSSVDSYRVVASKQMRVRSFK